MNTATTFIAAFLLTLAFLKIRRKQSSANDNARGNFNLDFELFCALGEKEYIKIKDDENKLMQEYSDLKFEFELKRQSVDEFLSWDHRKISTSQSSVFYEIHHEESAKYKTQESVNEFKQKHFNKYKDEALAKVDPHVFDNATIEDLNDMAFLMFLTRCEEIVLRKRLSII